MSLNGFNDSKIHGLPWPVMNVTVGQNVTIRLVNRDTSQAHGFWIYNSVKTYVKPVTVAPGQCLDVSFNASTVGTFLVYCAIFCTVHNSMLNGRFNVSS